MMKKLSLPALSSSMVSLAVMSLCAMSATAHAQNTERRFESAKRFKDHVEVRTNDGLYVIKPYSNEILKPVLFRKCKVVLLQAAI